MSAINQDYQTYHVQRHLRNSIGGAENNGSLYDEAFALMDSLKGSEQKEIIMKLIYIIQSQQKVINHLDSVCPAEDQEPPVFYPMSTPARRR